MYQCLIFFSIKKKIFNLYLVCINYRQFNQLVIPAEFYLIYCFLTPPSSDHNLLSHLI